MLGHHRLEHQIDMRDFGQLDNICNSLKPNTLNFQATAGNLLLFIPLRNLPTHRTGIDSVMSGHVIKV